MNAIVLNVMLRLYDTLKYGDIHEKFNFLKKKTKQDLKPFNTYQKQFEKI